MARISYNQNSDLKQSRAWHIQKVEETDLLIFPKCGHTMSMIPLVPMVVVVKVFAVITDPSDFLLPFS
jgi:hypothetical protein